MLDQILTLSISLVSFIAAIGLLTLLTKVFPSLNDVSANDIAATIELIAMNAASGVHWARQNMKHNTGAEKMEYVLKMLNEFAEANDLYIDEATIAAIAQKAYDDMKSEDLANMNNITDIVKDVVADVIAEMFAAEEHEGAELVDPGFGVVVKPCTDEEILDTIKIDLS